MNSAELWSGHEYAWIPERGRGQSFSPYAKRIKVLSVKKIVQYGNERRTAMCTFEVLDWEGHSPYPEPEYRTEPAREIVAFWDEFWSEHEEQLEKRKQQEAEKVRKEYEAEIERRKIINGLVSAGFNEDDIRFDKTFGSYVRIEKEAVKDWLRNFSIEEGQ